MIIFINFRKWGDYNNIWDNKHFIKFAYNGLGQKTAKEVHNGSQTYRIEYSNGFVYMCDGETYDLKEIND
jgi:hypothetical protein